MSIIPQFPDPRAPLISSDWTTIGRWEVPLSAVLNGRHGRRHGLFVYTVLYRQSALYTGMTHKSVYSRLKQHMAIPSHLGRCVNAVPVDMFTLDVIEVTGVLRIAERQRIEQLRPSLNIAERNRSRNTVEWTVSTIIRNHKKR